MFLNNIDFSVDIEGKKQKEKLKAAENKSPHVLVPRINPDVPSVPPSRSSETRSISLASHLNPSQVDAFPLVSVSPHLLLRPHFVRLPFYSILLSRYLGLSVRLKFTNNDFMEFKRIIFFNKVGILRLETVHLLSVAELLPHF